jgi:hypothetical protein
MFLKPNAADINLVIDLLNLFRKASGLHTNLQKSSVVPIQCDGQTIAAAKELLHCEFADFACLGIASLRQEAESSSPEYH